MGWFEVAETPDGRSFSVAAYRSGLVAAPGYPKKVAQASPSASVLFSPVGWLLGMVVNLVVFRGSWTVRIAPWKGRGSTSWKVRVPTEAESDSRCEALLQLINTGQWDPREEPPPSPARS